MAALTTALLSTGQALPESGILRLDGQFLVELLIQWFNILVLVIVLHRFLYKPVRGFMTARDSRIAADMDSAAAAREEAAKLKAEYQKRLDGVELEREEILARSREIGQKRADAIISDARQEAASIHRRGMEELRMEQENQRDDMKRAIIDVSTRMAGMFVKLSVDEATQDIYVEQALKHLEEDELWYE